DGYRCVPFTIAGFTLELLEPYRPDNPIANFLAKRGEGLYQLSLAVEDLDGAMAGLDRAGLDLIGPRADPDDVVQEGCGGQAGVLPPRRAFGVRLRLGERAPVAALARAAGAAA